MVVSGGCGGGGWSQCSLFERRHKTTAVESLCIFRCNHQPITHYFLLSFFSSFFSFFLFLLFRLLSTASYDAPGVSKKCMVRQDVAVHPMKYFTFIKVLWCVVAWCDVLWRGAA